MGITLLCVDNYNNMGITLLCVDNYNNMGISITPSVRENKGKNNNPEMKLKNPLLVAMVRTTLKTKMAMMRSEDDDDNSVIVESE